MSSFERAATRSVSYTKLENEALFDRHRLGEITRLVDIRPH
jgi:hypothetical protein